MFASRSPHGRLAHCAGYRPRVIAADRTAKEARDGEQSSYTAMAWATMFLTSPIDTPRTKR
jgi:hypothetical protein